LPFLFLRKSDGGDGSALALAAAALDAGESASFTSGAAHGLVETYLAWQAQCFHDDVNDLIHVMGKPAASNDWALQTYDIAAGTWADNSPTIAKDGHLYGALTSDPATGDLYLHPGVAQAADRALYRYRTGTGWSVVADPIFSSGLNLPTNGVGWHPNLYGSGQGGVCVLAEVNGLSEGMSCYKASNNAIQEISIGEGDLGRIYGQGVYFAAIDRLVLGGSKHILVAGHATTPTWTAVGAPPIPTKGDTMEIAGFGTMMQHPGNTNKLLILERGGDRTVYESTDANAWVDAGYTHPFVSNSYALCSLRGGLGCIAEFGSNTVTGRCNLFKPAA
jgi:hypothetical protein